MGVTIVIFLTPVASANCGTMTCDSSANGHELTTFGNPATRDSPEAKYATGSDLDGTDDRLEVSQDAGLAITGHLSLVIVFEVDDFSRFNRLLDVREPSTGDHLYSLLYNGNHDRLAYRHTDTSGTNDNFFVSNFQANYGTGLHTLTIRRDAVNENLVVKVDGTTEINAGGFGSVDPASETDLALGAATGGGGESDGGAYELRVWGSLVAQSTLDAIADPADPSYEDTAEGSETALWFLGPAGQTLFSDHFNDGTIDSSKWTTSGAGEDDKCGAVSQPYALRFRTSDPRWAETVDLDLSGGESAEFYLRDGSGDNPCGGKDPTIELQYSTDGGGSWSTIASYADPPTSWTFHDEALPTGAKTSSTRLRWIETFRPSGAHQWAIDDVVIDGSGGGGNSAPTADFTHDCTNLDCSFTDQSSDSDGSIASWSWDFGDGATSSQQHPSHTYSCDGTYTVTLTVTDDDGATDSTSTDVTVSDADSDGDGLSDCEETNIYGTDPTEADSDSDGLDDGEEVNTYPTDPLDPDTDHDEFWDGEEVNRFGTPEIFCGSVCGYPDPTTRDIYLEVDGIEDHCPFCHTHMISNDERDHIVQKFADRGINAHVDTGQLGGGGDLIDDDNLDDFADWDYLVANHEDNSNSFDPRRAGIFHHMVAVHHLSRGDETPCGIAQVSSVSNTDDPDDRPDFSALAHGSITDPLVCDDGDVSQAIRDIVLQEFGHNNFDEIEPDGDKCDTFHDKFEKYSMATGHCNAGIETADYKGGGHRWLELKTWLTEDECSETSIRDGDPATCPSAGDLNKGILTRVEGT